MDAFEEKPPNVTSSEFKATAYPFYAELRRTTPVYAAKLPDGQTAWLVTRYEDVNRALKDERLFKDKRKLRKRTGLNRLQGFLRSLEALERNMLDVDPPDHGRLRGLVHKGFTPRRVEQMAGRVERLADELLFEMGDGGTVRPPSRLRGSDPVHDHLRDARSLPPPTRFDFIAGRATSSPRARERTSGASLQACFDLCAT